MAIASPTHSAVGDRGKDLVITFPDTLLVQNGGPVINLKRPPEGIRAARGDGRTDDTESFRDAYDFLQREFVQHGGWNPQNYYIYLPNGTYRISDTLIYRGETVQQPKGQWKGENFDINHIRFVGQSRRGTIIRLADGAPGFQDPQNPKVVMAYQHPDTIFNNVPGSNYLRNLTISTGRDNPGAVGLYFQGANQSDIHSVTIRSEDGAGRYGIWFKIGSVQGYYSDVTVVGFDIGIFQTVNAEGDPAFEYLTLRSQKVVGFLHTGGGASIRSLLSDQHITGATAIRLDGSGVQSVLLDSELRGGGKSASVPAIETTAAAEQCLFVRNVLTAGYGESIRKAGTVAVAGNRVDEYCSYPATTSGPDTPARSLQLPIQDTPSVAWYDPATQWAVVDDYPSVQAAFLSGKPVVCFKKSHYELPGDVRVPASVRFVNGMAASIKGGALVVDGPSADPLLVQDSSVPIRVKARRTIIQRCASGGISNPDGLPVTFFLENVNDNATGDDFCKAGQKTFARQIDVEYGSGNQIVVNGGTLWIFGYKTENRPAVPFTIKAGGTLEILGGYTNTTSAHDDIPLIRNNGGNVSVTLFTNLGGRLTTAVEEISGNGKTTLPGTAFPHRGSVYRGDYVIPLYISRAGKEK